MSFTLVLFSVATKAGELTRRQEEEVHQKVRGNTGKKKKEQEKMKEK